MNIDLETFFSMNQALLCVAGLDGTFLKLNKAWEETLGYPLKELEGSTFIELVHPEDRESTLESLRELDQGRPIQKFVNRYRKSDGTYLHIEWRSIAKGGLVYATALDITDTVAANEEIKKLSKAMEYNPATIIITDPDGCITYVNEKFTDLTGYREDEVIGKKTSILKSGEQSQEFYKDLWDTISSGKPWRGMFHNIKKNGELYWESALIAPLFDEAGSIVNYVAMKEDITSQRKTEEAMRESNERLDLFFQQSLDGFFFMMLDEPVVWDGSVDKEAVLDYVFAHQRITKINQAMIDQYGGEKEDFLGLTPNDFYQHDIFYGREVWRKFFDDGKLHIDTEEQKYNGNPMIIEGDYICLYDKEGRISGHFGIQREVTFERNAREKLEESEGRFRQLADSIDQVFFLRTQNELLYVNKVYEKIWGQTRQSLYDDPDSFFKVVHPEDKEALFEAYRENMNNFSMEYRIIRPDGEVRWIWVKTFPVTGAEAGTMRTAGVAQDITRQKQLEEQLREASVRDSLTGLFNRRHLEVRMHPLIEKAKRDGELFSIALLDIDHFKETNDTYGHSAGDQVLKELSRMLSEGVRSYDLVGRYGGEEFIIIFFDADRQLAKSLMERILSQVRNTTVKYEEHSINVTFSCGVTDSRLCRENGCSLEILINEADDTMYKAKSSGRNRVLLA